MSGIYFYSENLALAGQLSQLALTLGEAPQAICLRQEDASRLANDPVQAVHLLTGDSSRPEDYAQAMAALIRNEDARLFLVGDTISGRELAARVAAVLDAGLVSGASQVVPVDGKFETERFQYGGAVVKKECLDQIAVITIPAGKYPAAEKSNKQAPILIHPVETDRRIQQIELTPIERQGAGLDKSKIVVGVGLGFNQKQDLSLAYELAKVLNAAVGCTRPVADDKKWLPTEQYIGISGATIHPDMYLAVGISGQIQHTAGIRDAKVVVAINKNENAPIFKAADFGLVGDLYQVLPLLIEEIKSR